MATFPHAQTPMTEGRIERLTVKNESSISTGEVVLVVNAGEDAGHQIASALLHDGYRVAVTGRHATQLSRIVHGHSTERVMAVAADTEDRRQVEELLRRVERRFGRPIDAVICATCVAGDYLHGHHGALAIAPERNRGVDAFELAL
jgi:NAD(P)-dependent dehydrogenase (short-subunit alcohol dehydrogenase family)